MILKLSKLFFILLSVSIVATVTASSADALTCNWTSAGSTSWNSTGNWSCARVPTAADDVVFNDSLSAISVTYDVASSTINTISISNYTGTITQSGSNTLTIDNTGGWSQSSGTFVGGSGDITINADGGDFVLSGGSFTSTSGILLVEDAFTVTGGTFTHNNGTVRLESTQFPDFGSIYARINLYNLYFYGDGLTVTLKEGTRLIVENTLTLETQGGGSELGNFLGKGFIEARGNINAVGQGYENTLGTTDTDTAAISDTTKIIVNGSGNQTIDGETDTNTTLPTLVINKATGKVTFTDTIVMGGSFIHKQGEMDFGTSTIMMGTGTFATVQKLEGRFSFNNFEIESDEENYIFMPAGTVASVSGTLTFEGSGGGAAAVELFGGGEFHAKGNIHTIDSGAATVNDVLGLTGVQLAPVKVYVDGTLDQRLYGETDTAAGAETFVPWLVVDKPSGTFIFNGTTDDIYTTSFTHIRGTMNPKTNLVNFVGGGGSNGTWSFYIEGNPNFHDVTFSGDNGVYNVSGTVTVGGTLTLSSTGGSGTSQIDGSGTIKAYGNVTTAQLGMDGDVNITLAGSNAVTLTHAAGDGFPDGTLTIDKSGGIATTSGNLVLDGATQDLVISSGTLQLASNNDLTIGDGLTINGNLLHGNNDSDLVMTAGSVTVGSTGSWVNNGIGDITIAGGQSVTNNGYVKFDGMTNQTDTPGCGDTDTIVITRSGSGTVAWNSSGSGKYRMYDVNFTTATGFTASPALTVYSSSKNATGNDDITLDATCPAIRTWTGGRQNTRWDNALNWDTGVVPATTDLVVFDATATSSAITTGNVDLSATGGGIEIRNGFSYASTAVASWALIQTTTDTVTLDTGGFLQQGGTFTGGSGNITIEAGGDFTQSGGTFTSTSGTLEAQDDWTMSGGTFTHNSGTVKLNALADSGATITGSTTFNNLTFDIDQGGSHTFTIASGTTLTASGTLTLTDDQGAGSATLSGSGGISAQASVTTTGEGIIGTAVITINGTASQTFTGEADTDTHVPAITIDKSSGTLSFVDTIVVSDNWTYTTGTLSMGSSTVKFNALADQEATITGSSAFNNLTFDIDQGGSHTFTIASGTTLTASGTLTLTDDQGAGDLTINGPGTLNAQGNLTTSGDGTAGDVAVSLSGTSNQTATISGTSFPTGTVTIDKPSGTVTLASNFSVNSSGQDFVFTSGTLDTNSRNVTVNDVFTITRGTLSQTTGTITAGAYILDKLARWTNYSTGDITVGTGGMYNNGEIILDGTAAGCGDADAISITSSSAGTAREWFGSGKEQFYDVTIQDQNGSVPAYSSTAVSNTTFHVSANCPSTSHWKFDEGTGSTANDSGDNKANGTLNNTPTYQTEDQCIAGKCIWFDGANNENVSVADNALLDFAASESFTLSAWVRRNGASSANNFILTKAQSGYTGYKMYQDASGDYCFDVSDGTNTDTACTSAVDFDDNQWHHVTGVKSGTSSITLYVDGKQRAQDASIAATGTLANTGTFYTGVDLDGTSNEWLGFIDEVKVYRIAKSASQIQTEFTARGSTDGSNILGARSDQNLSNGLVGYWKMDEASWTVNCSTESVLDASGNSNNGAACPNSTGPAGGATGKFGNSGLFDGGDSIDIDDNATLDSTATDNLTLAAWFKRTGSGPFNNPMVVFDKRNTEASAGYSFRLEETSSCSLGNNSGNLLCFSIHDGTDEYFMYTTTATITADSVWHHVVAVLDRNNENNTLIYIDGIAQAVTRSGTLTSIGDISNALQLCIGQDQVGSECRTSDTNYGFRGNIDEARVYKRALSSAEVTQLYNFAPGPVGYWDFEEKQGVTANDKSGNANTGTLSNGTAWTTGKVGSAASFDGANDVVDAGSAATLDDITTKTITAWIYPKSLGENNAGYIVSKIDSNSTTGWDFQLNNSTNANSLSYFQPFSGTDLWYLTPANSIVLNKWAHVAVTYDNSTTANIPTIYIDGIKQTLTLASGPPTGTRATDASEALDIGNYTGGDTTFDGYIDEVRIYNYIRTPQQIVEDMNAGHPAGGSPVGSQVAYYKFDEGYGTTANSSITPNIIGTLTSGPTWTNGGKYGKAVQFDGSNDVISVTNQNSIDFDTNLASGSSFTTWVRATNAGEGNAGHVYDKGQGRRLRLLNPSGSNLDVEAFLDLETTDAVATVSAGITVGTWNQIAVVYQDDNDDEIEIYINGILRATSSGGVGRPTSGSLTDTSNLSIGGNAANNFAGDIDEFKVYSSALTAPQIAIDYNRNASQVLGALSTDANGTATNSAERSYCPPGDTTATCAPVGYWRFEERQGTSAQDISGNANTGTLTSGPAWSSGKVGSAIKFDGSNDRVDVGAGSSLNLGSSTAKSFSAWVYPTALGAASTYKNVLSNCDSTGGSCQYGIAFNGTNLDYYWASANQFEDYTLTSYDFQINRWYHIEVVDSTANTVYFYINGVRYTPTRSGNFSSGTQENTVIGRDGEANQQYFTGIIDEVKIYNYARSASQVAWDYNYGKPVGHWKMDECSGTTINDSSGNGFAGTWSGSGGSQTSAGTCTTSAETAWYNGRNGKLNYSLSFDGTDDQVNVGGTTDDTFRLSDRITMSAWIKSDASGTSNNPAILTRWAAGQEHYHMDITSGVLSSYLGGTTVTGNKNINSAGATWYHVAVAWDKDINSGTITLYVNGRADATGTRTTSMSTSDQPNIIGANNGAGSFFDGQIDDVKIFNYALSSKQVQELYNSGAVRFSPSTGAP